MSELERGWASDNGWRDDATVAVGPFSVSNARLLDHHCGPLNDDGSLAREARPMPNDDSRPGRGVDDWWGCLDGDNLRLWGDDRGAGSRRMEDHIANDRCGSNSGKNFANHSPFFVPGMGRVWC